MNNKMISYISILAILAPITGNMAFLAFLSFLAFIKIKKDERFIQNRDKAARNGFVVSLISIVIMLFCLSFNPDFLNKDKIILFIQATLFAISFTLAISFTYYDKKGMG